MTLQMELQKEISLFKTVWKERFDLQEQIDTEKNLNEELRKSHFTENLYDFEIDFPSFWFNNKQYRKQLGDSQFADFDFSKPLIKQIKDLETKRDELNERYTSLLNGPQNKDEITNAELLKMKIQSTKEEIKKLDLNVNKILDKIVSFEDDELHELRTRKQHLDLQKKSKGKSYP